VQFQIPLPITFADELIHLLSAELVMPSRSRPSSFLLNSLRLPTNSPLFSAHSVQDANSRAGKFFYISQWLQVDLVAAEPIPAPFRGDLSEVQAKLAQSSADYRLIRRLGRDKMRVSLANATEPTRP
jgi:hypothetical protein